MSDVVRMAGRMVRPRLASRFATSLVAAAVAVAVSSAALAADSTAAKKKDVEELGEITVTGSRIQQAVGMTTPTPVTSVTATELSAMSPGSLTDAMTQLPQFYLSQTAENFNTGANGFFQSGGGGALDLRGIGPQRTLTLMDGRRIVPASVFGGPDINMLPSEMVKRIETVTGGASAAYGTDAVSGVVNYILDTSFEGFRAKGQVGETSRGDGRNNEYGFSLGHQFGDKFHLLFSVEHQHQNAITSYDGRSWYDSCSLVSNPASGAGTSLSNPQFLPACNLHSTNASFDGIITAAVGPTGANVPLPTRMTFNSDGTLTPLQPGTQVFPGSNAQVGGGGTDTNSERANVSPGQNRNNVFTYLKYDVTDNTDVFFQGLYGKQQLKAVNISGSFYAGGAFQNLTIYQGNPFLGDPATPGSAANWMQQNNIAAFTLGRIGDVADLNSGSVENDSTVKQGTLGFHSTVAADGYFKGWDIEGYYQYGKDDLDAKQMGVRVDRIFLAADAVVDPATGRVMCHVTLVSGLMPDCVPLNLFGRGQASQQAIDWVTGFDPGVSVTTTPYLADSTPPPVSYVGDEYKHRLASLKEQIAELSASGKVAHGWAGDITAAIGASWRKESVNQFVEASQGNPSASPNFYPAWCNDPNVAGTVSNGPQCSAAILAANNGRPAGTIGVRGVPAGVQTNVVEFQFSKVPNILGSFDVKEAFAETIVPLLSDQPWMKNLNFQGALRWADYGGSGTIWSYKAGLDAQFTDEVRLRGTYSRDVRAANIDERFDRTGGFANVIDRKNGGTSSVGVTTVTGGNPNLDPEKADTYTFGVVYRPTWLSGLDMSIDWLSVNLTGMIAALTPQNIVDGCYVNGDADQCAKITRDAGTDTLLFVNSSYQNLNKTKISGLDAEFGYTHRVTIVGGDERLGLRLISSYLNEYKRTNSAGVVTDVRGDVGSQLLKWKATAMLNYGNGPFSWNLQARYLGKGLLSSSYNLPNATTGVVTYNVANNTIGSVTYFDTRVGYKIPMGDGTLELYGNVNNLLDRDPPLVLSPFGGLFANGGQSATTYDSLGRRFVVGFNLKF
jgi:iron complex outermembrane receptor protein